MPMLNASVCPRNCIITGGVRSERAQRYAVHRNLIVEKVWFVAEAEPRNDSMQLRSC